MPIVATAYQLSKHPSSVYGSEKGWSGLLKEKKSGGHMPGVSFPPPLELLLLPLFPFLSFDDELPPELPP